MGIAIIGMVIVAIVLLIAIPVLMRVFGEAVDRNPNQPGDEDTEEKQRSNRSGPNRR